MLSNVIHQWFHEIVRPFCAPFPGTHLWQSEEEKNTQNSGSLCFFHVTNRAYVLSLLENLRCFSPLIWINWFVADFIWGYDQTAALAARAVVTWLPLPRAQLLGIDGLWRNWSPKMEAHGWQDDTNTAPFSPPPPTPPKKKEKAWKSNLRGLSKNQSNVSWMNSCPFECLQVLAKPFPTTHPSSKICPILQLGSSHFAQSLQSLALAQFQHKASWASVVGKRCQKPPSKSKIPIFLCRHLVGDQCLENIIQGSFAEMGSAVHSQKKKTSTHQEQRSTL